MIEKATYSVKYPSGNRFNVWGDFERLFAMLTRRAPSGLIQIRY